MLAACNTCVRSVAVCRPRRVAPLARRVACPWHAVSPGATQAPLAPQAPADPWKRAVDLEQSGEAVEVTVRRFNRGGVIVKLGDLEGFIPYNQMASTSIRKGHAGDLSYLLGQKLRARVMSVDLAGPKREVILSERRVMQTEMLQRLKVGQVMRAVVRGLEEYGVFMELVDLPGLTGMVHRSEISWDPVSVAESGLERGAVVNVLVLDVDPTRARLSLSIKQLQQDPLKTTLDTLSWGPTGAVPPEIQRLVDRLSAYPGVNSVMVTRQARDTHHVAQEVQVFLTKEADEDGSHMVVARVGPVLQELQLLTSLSREQVKEALQAVTTAGK